MPIHLNNLETSLQTQINNSEMIACDGDEIEGAIIDSM